MGGEWEERTDGTMQILRTIYLKCVCHVTFSFIRSSFSWRGRRKPLLFYITPRWMTLNVLRQYGILMFYNFYSCSQPRPQRRARQHSGTSTHSQVKYTRPRPHHCPSAWQKVVALRDGFSAKAWGEAWERDLSSDVGIDSHSNDSARKMYVTLVQDRDHEVHSFPSRFPSSRTVIFPTMQPIPVPLLNNPAPERACSPKTTTERPTRGSRPARQLPHFHKCIRDAGRQPRLALEFVILLSADR
jgi:dynein light intermediate chain 1